jgi:hypothetical protein
MRRKSKSRWPSRPLTGKSASMPPFDNPSIMAGTTLYPRTIRTGRGGTVLKSGVNNRKSGGEITTGKWKGFPVLTLTLIERETCPRYCKMWRACYGNNMHYAHRWKAGPDLEWRLEREIALLEIDHPTGFAVRLHILGDFCTLQHVNL